MILNDATLLVSALLGLAGFLLAYLARDVRGQTEVARLQAERDQLLAEIEALSWSDPVAHPAGTDSEKPKRAEKPKQVSLGDDGEMIER